MMRFLSHSREEQSSGARGANYESTVTLQSRSYPGVEFTVVRLSFARRMELARRVLALNKALEFRQAGTSVEESIEANILGCEIDHLYLRWGLVRITGLTIDGTAATAESLYDSGPEDLGNEIVAAIKAECGLSEKERKN